MNEPDKSIPVPPAPPQNIPAALTEVDYLRQIAEHLRSIRAMLSFFTLIIILAVILQVLAGIVPVLGP